MARRLPSSAPNLAGFSYVRVLGSGGFADVFLYEQNMPRRQVAVKVLLAEVVTPQVRRMFQAEANVMAQLSAHPSVLTVYQASVSSDGRPYLVMELCSPALNRRYRLEPVAVPDVLRVGVKIASAVETAHRSGVLHRDLKPSNILMTAYGNPVLSDFGIASTLGEGDLEHVVGLSIPWSAPEVLLDESPGSVASEVYSLGATVYSLLAGRSPFEMPGAENTSSELIARIRKSRAPEIERDDVPRSLQGVLQKSLSKRPELRQRTVLELIRDLQSVEAELSFAQTPIEVAIDDWAAATASDPQDHTRITGLLEPDSGPQMGGGAARRGGRRHGGGHARAGTGTYREQAAGATSGSGGGVTAGRWPTRTVAWLLVTCATLVVILGTIAAVVLVRTSTADDVPTVHDIAGHVSGGTIVFSWKDPGLQASDSYQVQVGSTAPSIQHSSQFRVDAVDGQRVCITVTVNRNGKAGEASLPKCVEPGETP